MKIRARLCCLWSSHRSRRYWACLSVLAEYIGPHKILWATDYPHPDGFFPGAPKLISTRPELSEETKRQILAGGAKRFYALT
jgi:uncharacterized protein